MSIRRLYYTADLVNKISIAYIFIKYTCNYGRVCMCVCVCFCGPVFNSWLCCTTWLSQYTEISVVAPKTKLKILNSSCRRLLHSCTHSSHSHCYHTIPKWKFLDLNYNRTISTVPNYTSNGFTVFRCVCSDAAVNLQHTAQFTLFTRVNWQIVVILDV